MPYVDLHSQPCYASIFYMTNSQFNNVGGFCPNKPTAVILHPKFLDSTWLAFQFADPRLSGPYNLIAFDMRSCGQSSCSLDARHDSWVDAADLALCFQRLHLSPSHILALEAISVNCALRFAVLFPEMCLSLTLVNVPSPMASRTSRATQEEMIHACCFAEDLESFEYAVQENICYLFGEECDSELQDELISFWTTRFPPRLRPRLAETVNILMNRTPLGPEIYALITQPVLIIHGDKNDLYPIKHAEHLSSQLTGVKDGAILYSVKGGRSMLSVIPGHASIMNKVVSNFWSRLPHHASPMIPPKTPVEVRMAEALETLVTLTGCERGSQIDPLCALSFSCLSPDVIKVQSELLEHYKKDCNRTFSPLSASGRPLRKFSKKESEHWFSAESHGLSIASSSFLPTRYRKRLTERTEKKISRPEFPIQGSVHDNLPQITASTESKTLKVSSPKTHDRSSTPVYLGSEPKGLTSFAI